MTDTKRSPQALGILVGALIISLVADLASKEWALDNLSAEVPGGNDPVCTPDEQGNMHMQRMRRPAVSIIPNHLELRYAENCGAAFGLMHKAPQIARILVFGTTALGVSGALLFMLFRGRGGRLFGWAVPLIVSGAIGNFADRVRHGFVVDFVRAYWGTWEWPTFNVADATILVGISFWLIEVARQKEPAAKPTAELKPADTEPS